MTTSKSGSGTWGLKHATYGQIAKALEMLGGRVSRTTGNGYILYEVNGKSVTLRQHSDASREVGRGLLKQYIDQAEQAHIPALLFVAALSIAGAAWYKQSTDLRILEGIAKRHTRLLASHEGRKIVLATLLKELEDKGIERKEEVITPTAEQGDDATQTPQLEHPYSITMTIGLTNPASRAETGRRVARLQYWLKGKDPEAVRLMEAGQIKKMVAPTTGRRPVWRFTEEAALVMAQRIEAAVAGTLTTAPGEAEQPRDAAQRDATQRDAAPTPATAEEIMPTSTAGPTRAAPLPGDEYDEIQELGMAVLALCQLHDTFPVMRGLTIDVTATILKLGKEATGAARK